MYNDGSMSGGNSSPILRNVSFSGNSASVAGGAIYNAGNDTGNSDPTLVNIILWGDSVDAGGSGAEIYNSTATPTISYSVVQGSGGSGAGWDTTLGTDGGNNLDAEPMLGPLADNGGSTDTMELIWGSSANDTGDDATCTAAPVSGVDQRGVPRPVGPHCDIGALERVPPEIRADFDSDGLAEIGYFRAASGLWALLESSEGFSYAMPRYYSWGQTGDILALGDYDGDGRMDPTVRRPPESGQSAAYRILLSTTDYDFGSSLTVPAGWPGIGDTPVPGDYNRDGVTDPAIWRGSAGVWIIPLSPGFTTYAFLSWGITGDTPVGADVDGDGQADIGYWRPSTGVWGFLKSTQGYSYSSPLYFSWGQSGDIPVMADYDGDHKADPAVVIPPAGGQSRAYRILLSTMSYSPGSSLTIPAGWPGLNDTPVPADYDGDRKADAAIWRGNTGVWIIPKSSTNNTSYMFAAWGATGDVPAR
jgi:predicted outer membrane repeat protein